MGGTGYALSGLSHATTYWWQVRAVNAGGQWWYFTTAPTSGASAAFGKRAPVNNAAGSC